MVQEQTFSAVPIIKKESQSDSDSSSLNLSQDFFELNEVHDHSNSLDKSGEYNKH